MSVKSPVQSHDHEGSPVQHRGSLVYKVTDFASARHWSVDMKTLKLSEDRIVIVTKNRSYTQ